MNTSTEAAAIADTSDTSEASTGREPIGSATYSPDDNKLRIYPLHRLSAEDYARVKAAGYAWAPRQELFVAPMWTPEREALAIELCGEIGDEDTSLTDRAEDRAERFEGYSERRADEAASARDGVARIADNIPFGQPILIGHHSERHARKDAEKIENGMRRAVKLWETASYWEQRAAGALRAAKYKELPDVRARRIKGIEADQRKAQKERDGAERFLALWQTAIEGGQGWKAERADGTPTTPRSRCLTLANMSAAGACDYGLWSDLDADRITPEEAARRAIASCERRIAWAAPWLNHYANRLAYERAMLAEAGGLVADRFDLQPGGVIDTTRGRRQVIVRVNRKDGRALSVTVAGQSWTVGVEEITDYQPPSEQAAAAVAAAVKVKPLCNYDGGASFARMTEAEYKALYEGSRLIRPVKATETHEAHRLRYVSGYLSAKHGGPAIAGYDIAPVFLTDAKIKPAPVNGGDPAKPPRKTTARKIAEAAGIDTAGQPDEAPAPAPTLRDIVRDATAPTLADVQAETARLQARNAAAAERKADGAEFDAMREALRTGQAVQVVSAPQLFPTPAEIAARMVALADVQAGECVLEPSAGTGAIARAVLDAVDTEVMAYEINPKLCAGLSSAFPPNQLQARCRDFLEVTDFQGGYPVVLMNPPFADGADIKHIKHARTFLAPGGRLVAICAAGPRQHAELQPLADSWEYLPAGTFAHTNVRAVLLTIRN